jgi:hypothetical protein
VIVTFYSLAPLFDRTLACGQPLCETRRMLNEETSTNQRTTLAELTDIVAFGGLLVVIGAAAYLLIH